MRIDRFIPSMQGTRESIWTSIWSLGWLTIAIVLAIGASTPLSAEETVETADPTLKQKASRSEGSAGAPYKAVVLEHDATVLSGPEASFYPTTKLSKGEQVEVYRVDAKHWLAIRPPQDSFSWVSAEHVELTESGTRARVINTPAKTRIGSQFSDEHDVEYISLNQGEILELLGTKMLEDEETGAPRRWFKIAPPAGEFRWIHANSVARLDHDPGEPEAISAQIKTFDLPNVESQANKQFNHAVANVTQQRTIATQSIPTREIQTQEFQPVAAKSAERVSVSAQRSVKPVESDGFRLLGEGESVRQASFESAPVAKTNSHPPQNRTLASKGRRDRLSTHINAVTWEAIGDPANPLDAPEPRTFEDSYEALNILLSRAVLGNVEEWQLERVFGQADLLKRNAQSSDQLALADQLMAKIQEFQELQKRKLQMQTVDVVDDVAANSQVSLVNYDAAYLAKSGSSIGHEPGRLPTYLQDMAHMPSGPSVARSRVAATQKRAPAKKRPTMPQRIVREKQTKRNAAPDLKPAAVLDNSVFDASGTLIQVHSRRQGMPRYALTDSSGRITRFVSTGDGSSLDHLVNSRVGLLGEIGLLSELNKSHVIAVKAVKLQR